MILLKPFEYKLVKNNMKNSNIQHLFWRAGFGLSPKEWQERQDWSVPQAVDYLFQEAITQSQKLRTQTGNYTRKKRSKDLSEKEKAKQRGAERKLVRSHNIDWLLTMGTGGESDLLHKMTLFWHEHFACTTKSGNLAYNQLLTLKKHALGNFKDLVIAIAKDPSMIRFLNNQQNRKNRPNENFARELMELFTIGRGNYTEQDVKEAARAFTGWSSNFKGEFVFKNRQHDFDEKRFMGQNGKFDGTEIIDILLEQRATAIFICRKVYRYFVNPKIEESRVQALANLFYESDYDIALLMRTIFTSNWFYNSENQKVKIKSPTEFLAGMIRQLDLTINNKIALFGIQKNLGQILFNPPNVAGWIGGKNWIDNATLMLRLSLPQAIFSAVEINSREKGNLENKGIAAKLRKLNTSANLQPLMDMLATTDKKEAANQLSEYLLTQQVPQHLADLEKFIISNSSEAFIKSLTMRLMMLPEYQLC